MQRDRPESAATPHRFANWRRIRLALALTAAMAMGMLLATETPAQAGPYFGHRPPGVVSPNNVFQPSGGRANGVVMLIHGGGFVLVGAGDLMRADAHWWHQHRYITYDIDYRGGLDSLSDVMAAYDRLRRRVHYQPICVMGDSAGGTLALLLDVERPSVGCVITEGAISNENTMPEAFRTATATWAIPGHMSAWSPVQYPRRIHAPTLMGGSSLDPVVPEREQLDEMKAVRPQTQTMLLAGAPASDPYQTNFTHASVTPQALARFRVAMLKLADSATDRPH